MNKRQCIIKKIWIAGTPYIQAGGWLILMITVLGNGITLIEKATAFDRRITALEQDKVQIALLNQKVDMILDFWGIARK